MANIGPNAGERQGTGEGDGPPRFRAMSSKMSSRSIGQPAVGSPVLPKQYMQARVHFQEDHYKSLNKEYLRGLKGGRHPRSYPRKTELWEHIRVSENRRNRVNKGHQLWSVFGDDDDYEYSRHKAEELASEHRADEEKAAEDARSAADPAGHFRPSRSRSGSPAGRDSARGRRGGGSPTSARTGSPAPSRSRAGTPGVDGEEAQTGSASGDTAATGQDGGAADTDKSVAGQSAATSAASATSSDLFAHPLYKHGRTGLPMLKKDIHNAYMNSAEILALARESTKVWMLMQASMAANTPENVSSSPYDAGRAGSTAKQMAALRKAARLSSVDSVVDREEIRHDDGGMPAGSAGSGAQQRADRQLQQVMMAEAQEHLQAEEGSSDPPPHGHIMHRHRHMHHGPRAARGHGRQRGGKTRHHHHHHHHHHKHKHGHGRHKHGRTSTPHGPHNTLHDPARPVLARTQSGVVIHHGATVMLRTPFGRYLSVRVPKGEIQARHLNELSRGDRASFTMSNIEQPALIRPLCYGDPIWMVIAVGMGEPTWMQGSVLAAKVKHALSVPSVKLTANGGGVANSNAFADAAPRGRWRKNKQRRATQPRDLGSESSTARSTSTGANDDGAAVGNSDGDGVVGDEEKQGDGGNTGDRISVPSSARSSGTTEARSDSATENDEDRGAHADEADAPVGVPYPARVGLIRRDDTGGSSLIADEESARQRYKLAVNAGKWVLRHATLLHQADGHPVHSGDDVYWEQDQFSIWCDPQTGESSLRSIQFRDLQTYEHAVDRKSVFTIFLCEGSEDESKLSNEEFRAHQLLQRAKRNLKRSAKSRTGGTRTYPHLATEDGAPLKGGHGFAKEVRRLINKSVTEKEKTRMNPHRRKQTVLLDHASTLFAKTAPTPMRHTLSDAQLLHLALHGNITSDEELTNVVVDIMGENISEEDRASPAGPQLLQRLQMQRLQQHYGEISPISPFVFRLPPIEGVLPEHMVAQCDLQLPSSSSVQSKNYNDEVSMTSSVSASVLGSQTKRADDDGIELQDPYVQTVLRVLDPFGFVEAAKGVKYRFEDDLAEWLAERQQHVQAQQALQATTEAAASRANSSPGKTRPGNNGNATAASDSAAGGGIFITSTPSRDSRAQTPSSRSGRRRPRSRADSNSKRGESPPPFGEFGGSFSGGILDGGMPTDTRTGSRGNNRSRAGARDKRGGSPSTGGVDSISEATLMPNKARLGTMGDENGPSNPFVPASSILSTKNKAAIDEHREQLQNSMTEVASPDAKLHRATYPLVLSMDDHDQEESQKRLLQAIGVLQAFVKFRHGHAHPHQGRHASMEQGASGMMSAAISAQSSSSSAGGMMDGTPSGGNTARPDSDEGAGSASSTQSKRRPSQLKGMNLDMLRRRGSLGFDNIGSAVEAQARHRDAMERMQAISGPGSSHQTHSSRTKTDTTPSAGAPRESDARVATSATTVSEDEQSETADGVSRSMADSVSVLTPINDDGSQAEGAELGTDGANGIGDGEIDPEELAARAMAASYQAQSGDVGDASPTAPAASSSTQSHAVTGGLGGTSSGAGAGVGSSSVTSEGSDFPDLSSMERMMLSLQLEDTQMAKNIQFRERETYRQYVTSIFHSMEVQNLRRHEEAAASSLKTVREDSDHGGERTNTTRRETSAATGTNTCADVAAPTGASHPAEPSPADTQAAASALPTASAVSPEQTSPSPLDSLLPQLDQLDTAAAEENAKHRIRLSPRHVGKTLKRTPSQVPSRFKPPVSFSDPAVRNRRIAIMHNFVPFHATDDDPSAPRIEDSIVSPAAAEARAFL